MKARGGNLIKDISGFISLYRISGLAPYSPQPLEQLLLILFQLLHFAVVIYIFIAAFFLNNAFKESSLSGLVSGLVFVALTFAHIVLNLQALITRKEQHKMFEMFALIDSEFKDKIAVHPNTKQWNKKFIISFLVVLIILVGNDLAICVNKIINRIYDAFWFALFSRQLVRFRLFQCMHYVQMCSERLELLNRKIEDIVAYGKVSSPNFIIMQSEYGKYQFVSSTKSNDQSTERILVLKQIFGHVWEASNMINTCFGWSLLAIITYSFLDFTSNGYWLFLALENLLPKYVVLECLCRMIPLAFMLSILSWVCNSCKQRSERTGCLVHKLEKSSESEQYNALVSEFSLQVMHEPIHISANGFFNIDFELLGATSISSNATYISLKHWINKWKIFQMAAATVTYLVILIQFLLSEKSHKQASPTAETATEITAS